MADPNQAYPDERPFAAAQSAGFAGDPPKNEIVKNGIKLLGEAVLPGASELLEQRVARGALLAGLGLGAPAAMVALLGPAAGGVIGGSIALGTRVWSYWSSNQPQDRQWPFDGGASSLKQQIRSAFMSGSIDENQYKTMMGQL